MRSARRQAAGDSASDLPVRALALRRLGFSAFLVSCTVLMLYSFAVAVDPAAVAEALSVARALQGRKRDRGAQLYRPEPGVRALCDRAGLPDRVAAAARPCTASRRCSCALAIGFLANMMFVVVSRTALVTLPILLVVFALLHLRRRAALLAAGAMGLFAVLLWTVSPHLRATVAKFSGDYDVSIAGNDDQRHGRRDWSTGASRWRSSRTRR